MKKQLSFKICDTEENAIELCASINASVSYYMRKNHPANYTPWSNSEGTEHGFIVWYRA